MEIITIYPKNEKQNSLLKALLEEMQVRFEISRKGDDSLLSEKEFLSKIDRSLKQAELGQTRVLSKDDQKKILGF